MYTIYSTTKGKRVCIYDGFVSDSRIKLIDPELELSANSPGSLTFTIPPNHVAYNDYDIVEYDVIKAGESANTYDVNGIKCVFRGYVVNEDDLYAIKNPYIGDTWAIPVMPPSDELTGEDGNWSIVSGKTWIDLYLHYVTPIIRNEVIVGYTPAISTFNSANWYRRIDDDASYMVFGLSDIRDGKAIIDFELMTESAQPDDWLTNYYISYYVKDEETELYHTIPVQEEAPEYEPNKYYVRQWVHVDTNLPVYKEKVTKLNLVERMLSTITVYRMETYHDGPKFGRRYDKEIWSGRVISEEVDWNGCRKIYCEGAFGYLNDTLQPQRVWPASTTLYQFITDILNHHNSKASDDHKFLRGEIQDVINKNATPVTSSTSPVLGQWTTDYGSTMETLSALVDKYGGYFRVDPPDKDGGYHKLSYICAPEENQSDQAKQNLVDADKCISLGKNLLDFTKRWDMSSLVTSIIPAGAIKNEQQVSVGEELVRAEEKGKVLAQKATYDYQPVSTRPGDWETNYFNYYTVSDTTQNGFKKISKNRKGTVPSFPPTTKQGGELPVYARIKNDGSRIYICSAGSQYQIIRAAVTAGKNYYISTTIDADHYAWAWYDSSGNVLDENNSSKSTKTTIYKEQKKTAPEGAAWIRVCGYGTNAAISVKDENEDKDEEFDRRWRITDHANDGDWHTQGSEYISNPDLVAKYGYIERQVTFDNITKTSDSETDASVINRLYDEAKKYLQSTQFDQMSLEVEATDLRIMGVACEGLMLYDAVYVKSEPHGLDRIFPITELTIPIARPEELRITLGYETDSTISGVTTSTSSGLKAEVKSIPSQNSTLKAAKERAGELIFGDSQRGVVRFEEATGTSQTDPAGVKGTIRAIEIVNNAYDQSPEQTGKWRWSYGGLGFARKQGGVWQPPDVAITNEGQIVADFVSTGTMSADRIEGGTLTLGKNVDQDLHRGVATMRIYDGDGDLVATADRDGYISYSEWSGNSANYTRVDNGIVTGGEATRNNAGDVTSKIEYGQIRPYYQNGSRKAVAIEANYRSGNQTQEGDIILASNRLLVTTGKLGDPATVLKRGLWREGQQRLSVVIGTDGNGNLQFGTIEVTNGIITDCSF